MQTGKFARAVQLLLPCLLAATAIPYAAIAQQYPPG